MNKPDVKQFDISIEINKTQICITKSGKSHWLMILKTDC